ncbi:transcriptional regulator of acetoin/glycerol metabolism [Rhizobium azooxidifex]|uniref:Transcriptional regulator of acetoin/glycerol metabolism n=1 Tax=Mycoplana azooxidifex TaxID=1636188 RepID=A0A7W6DGX0_9HYPH|nr:transcriptional regulator of acetoin/glycerol metabolism [Mycoplana azooxidifex]
MSKFLNLEVDGLSELTRRRPTQDRLVFARDGNALFAHAIEPQTQRRASAWVHGEIPQAIRRLGGDTPEIVALQAKVAKLARTALPVLIQGETGSGKEHLVRAIHEGSGLTGGFVAINVRLSPSSTSAQLSAAFAATVRLASSIATPSAIAVRVSSWRVVR